MTREPVTAALIGISGYGGTYYELVRRAVQTGCLRLVAATVINPESETDKCRELRRMGCAIYNDYREMLAAWEGRIELCLIPTGIGWHRPMTVAALATGANVLVEKPLAGSLADADAIREAEASAPGFVAVGFQDIYATSVRELKRALLAGRIGTLERLRLIANWPRTRRYYQRAAWAGCLRQGDTVINDSPLNNALSHFLNLALFLAGSTEEESARAELLDADLLRANPIESFDTACLHARLSTGPELRCVVSHAGARLHGPILVIEGSAGRACWHTSEGISIETDGGGLEKIAHDSSPTAREQMFADVIERVRAPGTFICGTDIARAHAELIEQLHGRFPIRDFPAGLVREVSLEDDAMQVVDGLEEAMEQAFAADSLLRETGLLAAR